MLPDPFSLRISNWGLGHKTTQTRAFYQTVAEDQLDSDAEAHVRGLVSGLADTLRHTVIKLWAFGGGIRYPDS